MIVSMLPKSYREGYLNSTSSVRTEFLAEGTGEITIRQPQSKKSQNEAGQRPQKEPYDRVNFGKLRTRSHSGNTTMKVTRRKCSFAYDVFAAHATEYDETF